MRRSARFAAERIADIAAAGWEVVVTHGNGPQVGRILLQQEAARGFVAPMPLDICGAESQGQIGYLLQTTVGDVFYERGMERPVVAILTLTRVHKDDPAFVHPTKPIGPYYGEDDANRLAESEGYVMRPSPDGGWRRGRSRLRGRAAPDRAGRGRGQGPGRGHPGPGTSRPRSSWS
jgi:carbamate kinase